MSKRLGGRDNGGAGDFAGLTNQDFQAPDLIGTVEGWRAWGVPVKLPRYGTSVKLYSVTYREYFWKPRQTMEAKCQGNPLECIKGGRVPGESCSCGFYSAKTLHHLMSMNYHLYDAEEKGYFHVVGQVANWGKVIEGTQGWRAQKSYPVKLFLPFEASHLAKPLADSYGVPVSLKNILTPTNRQEAM